MNTCYFYVFLNFFLFLYQAHTVLFIYFINVRERMSLIYKFHINFIISYENFQSNLLSIHCCFPKITLSFSHNINYLKCDMNLYFDSVLHRFQPLFSQLKRITWVFSLSHICVFSPMSLHSHFRRGDIYNIFYLHAQHLKHITRKS